MNVENSRICTVQKMWLCGKCHRENLISYTACSKYSSCIAFLLDYNVTGNVYCSAPYHLYGNSYYRPLPIFYKSYVGLYKIRNGIENMKNVRKMKYQ